jgi:phytoene dehydrogenase-like protein
VRYVKGLKDASSMFVLYCELDYKFPIDSINFMILKGYDHVEREATAVSSNRRPDPPTLWMSNNCPWDPSLAPPGKTFISVMGVVPWKLEGTTWEAEQEKHADSIIKAVESRVPGFRKHIVNRNMHSPAFFEKEYYLHNASTYALSYLLTQMWSMKPQYRTPIKNLYATGQTTHPGAGINGLAGTNTTKVILKDLEEKKIKI